MSTLRVISVQWLCLFTLVSGSMAFAVGQFPLGPNPFLTPGAVCTHPNSYRYKEHIPYCKRNVDGGTKQQVIRNYNQQLGYNILPKNRSQFKIDHLIPLCAGGGNVIANLWPQHKSVYEITDPLEPLACQKMSEGVLTQARAIELIRRGKDHLEDVPSILAEMNAL